MSGGPGAIAVTGASGYLGRRVIARLHQMAVPAIACPGRRDGFDLTDRAATNAFFGRQRFDTVIHCAAAVPKTPAEYADEPAGEASLAMVGNLVAAGVDHVIFTSSMTVYPTDATMPVREDDATDTLAGYASCKRRAERLLCDRPGARTATILRLPGLFGPPRRNGLLFSATINLARGEAPPIPQATPLWAAMHVDDAAELVVRAATRPPQGTRILNVGYGEPMSVTLTVAQLADRFGVTMPKGDAPIFDMDLSILDATLGRPSRTLGERLDELVAAVRVEQEPARA